MAKSIKEISEITGFSEKLIRSCIRRLGGEESLVDVNRAGAIGGFSGFIYYHETVDFFIKFRNELCSVIVNDANYLGVPVIEFVQGICTTDESEIDIIYVIGGGLVLGDDVVGNYDRIVNAIVWYALESITSAYCE